MRLEKEFPGKGEVIFRYLKPFYEWLPNPVCIDDPWAMKRLEAFFCKHFIYADTVAVQCIRKLDQRDDDLYDDLYPLPFLDHETYYEDLLISRFRCCVPTTSAPFGLIESVFRTPEILQMFDEVYLEDITYLLQIECWKRIQEEMQHSYHPEVVRMVTSAFMRGMSYVILDLVGGTSHEHWGAQSSQALFELWKEGIIPFAVSLDDQQQTTCYVLSA